MAKEQAEDEPERQVRQPGQGEVVGPPGLARDDPRVLLAPDRLPGDRSGRRGGLGGHAGAPGARRPAAAARTALTMLWYPVQRQRFPSSPFTLRPSSRTVHAPQLEVSQPTTVPVRPRRVRR